MLFTVMCVEAESVISTLKTTVLPEYKAGTVHAKVFVVPEIVY